MAARVFLFLQGPPTGFWPRLAAGLEAAGHRALRVNLCLADRLFWPRPGALDYRGRFSRWRGWLRALLIREGITDILYYADRLPYHVEALALAHELGLRAWAMEFGYLRPDWLTLEPEAMGRRSSFPRDPARIRRLADGAPPPDRRLRYPHAFHEEALGEVIFNLSMSFGRPVYPFYRSDKYLPPVIDYLLWLPELAREPGMRRRAEALEARCAAREFPYTLVALQLQQDYQIRAATDYRHLHDMLAEIVASFAAHARAQRRLVVKIHPLDNGWENWPKRLGRLARRHGVAGRVHAIKGGNLTRLLRGADGAVLANSTVGLHALLDGVPVKALGHAIYDLPGLTHQGGLDAFWEAPAPVDRALADAFARALAATIQIKGSFYNREGQDAAIAEVVRRLG